MTTSVSTQFGVFSAAIYEPYFLNDATDPKWLMAGAAIKLIFTAEKTVANSSNISLLQFILPMVADQGDAAPLWKVDRSNSQALQPYFGMQDNADPETVDFSKVRGAMSLIKEKLKSGIGQTKGRGQPAYLVDAPRELVPKPDPKNSLSYWESRTTIFTVYPYLVDAPAGAKGNDRWLSGVSWGYTVMWNKGNPTFSIAPLKMRSKTSPPGTYSPGGSVTAKEESAAAGLWASKIATLHGRVPVPEWG